MAARVFPEFSGLLSVGYGLYCFVRPFQLRRRPALAAR
jgi:hypothetical protein